MGSRKRWPSRHFRNATGLIEVGVLVSTSTPDSIFRVMLVLLLTKLFQVRVPSGELNEAVAKLTAHGLTRDAGRRTSRCVGVHEPTVTAVQLRKVQQYFS